LNKPWPVLKLIKPPRTQRLPDIVTVEEAGKWLGSSLVFCLFNYFANSTVMDGKVISNVFLRITTTVPGSQYGIITISCLF